MSVKVAKVMSATAVARELRNDMNTTVYHEDAKNTKNAKMKGPAHRSSEGQQVLSVMNRTYGVPAFPSPLAGNPASFGDSPERQMRQASGSGSAESLALLRDLKTQLLIS